MYNRLGWGGIQIPPHHKIGRICGHLGRAPSGEHSAVCLVAAPLALRVVVRTLHTNLVQRPSLVSVVRTLLDEVDPVADSVCTRLRVDI